MSNIIWNQSKYVPDSVNAGDGDLVAVAFGKTKEIQAARAKAIAALPKLIEAAAGLLETIEAYELENEIDAGEDDEGAVKVLRSVLEEFSGVRNG